VARGHHPRGAIQGDPEVVLAAQFGLTGGDAHPDRQFDRALGGDCGVDGGPR
jgi:hypothetical protein